MMLNREDVRVLIDFPIYRGSLTTAKYVQNAFKRLRYQTKTWVERFNVQGSGLMNPNRLNPKELRLYRGGK